MNKNLKDFEKALKTVAKALDVSPQEVTPAQFKAASELSEWDMRKVGGFAAAKTLLYPETKVAGVGATATIQKGNFLKSKIKKQVNDEFLKIEFLDAFKEHIKNEPIKVHPPSNQKLKSGNKSRTTVVHVSDTHFGANIEASEMHNVNAFNWLVASRRMALLAEQVVGYKPQYRADTELVIAINGDIIAGVIHNQEWFADLLAKQAAGTMSILIQFISYCASHFGKVRVIMTSGNHGRAMHKGSKDRGNTHKWDSYETMIYLGVRHGIATIKNVSCEIPETPYAIVNIQGHNFFITHGDTVINTGNPGSSLNMKALNAQVNKIAVALGIKIAGILLGHHHVSTVQTLDIGLRVLFNGCLSGADPYVQSLGIMSNNPEQTIFEVTKEYPVGDIRFVSLEGADNRKDLDKIITTLKGNLK